MNAAASFSGDVVQTGVDLYDAPVIFQEGMHV